MDILNPYSTLEGLKKAHGEPAICELCGETVRRKDPLRGELVCEKCGYVFGPVLEYGERDIVQGDEE